MEPTQLNRKGIHHLKSWPICFAKVAAGEKPFEIRKDDRSFWVGDKIILHEWQPVTVDSRRVEAEGYTGRDIEGVIISVTRPDDLLAYSPGAIGEGYVVLGVYWGLSSPVSRDVK